MRYILIVVIFVVTGCASHNEAITRPFNDDQFTAWKNESLTLAKNPEVKRYFSTMATHWNQHHQKALTNCSSKSNREVELLMKISAEGIIQETIGKPWNRKSQCFAAVYNGVYVPEPPVQPFYISFVMR